MRIFVAASLLAFSILPALAQSANSLLPPDAMVRHFCGAAQLSSGAEFDEVAAIAQRLAVANPRIHIAVADSPVINAWDVELSTNISLICVPSGMVHFMGDTEGELAFILAHEIGHAIDFRCKSLIGRARVADQSRADAILAIVFGHGRGDAAGNQRVCETRADELGFNFMTHAGYDPEDAASALRKLSIYLGDTASGPSARFAALGRDHPITPDRIRHIGKLIARSSRRSLPAIQLVRVPD
jgi:Zn-dependent protease with chaperone function